MQFERLVRSSSQPILRPSPLALARQEGTRAPLNRPAAWLQRSAGNRAFGRAFDQVSGAPPLGISRPGDIHELEAERVAEAVMTTSAPLGVQRACACDGGPPCPACAEEEEVGAVQRKTDSTASTMSAPIAGSPIGAMGPGHAMDTATRSFFEARFGHDFGHVRLHTDERAASSARELNALAYTLGRDVVMGEGQYAPGTTTGRRLLAHELTHVLQQTHYAAPPAIYRLSAAMCAGSATCGTPDVAGAGVPKSWKLTLAVDREEKGLGRLASGNVGHTWIKLNDDGGTNYSYGFWPQVGFDPNHPFTPVPGCVHHPDTAHEPPAATDYIDIDYSISSSNYAKAISHAETVCKASPDYDLTSYNCTSFAIDVAKAAGITPPSSTTLAIPNPNALYEGIEEETKKRGAAGSGSSGSKKSP